MDCDGIFANFPTKVKFALLSKFEDFYSISKSHTIVVMPFWGLLHIIGNEPRPILNFVDMNILNLMSKDFKDVIVYAGENRYLYYYNARLDSATEHLAKEQYILSRIVNKSTNFQNVSQEHINISNEYNSALKDLNSFSKKYPLPYSTAFSIGDSTDLLTYVKEIYENSKQKDRLTNICLIYPINYLQDNDNENYLQVKDYINSIGGTLFISQNQCDNYMHSNSYGFIYDDFYPEEVIHSIQDFAKTYNRQKSYEAKKAFKIDELYNEISQDLLNHYQNEVIEKIENIDVAEIFNNHYLNCIHQDSM